MSEYKFEFNNANEHLSSHPFTKYDNYEFAGLDITQNQKNISNQQQRKDGNINFATDLNANDLENLKIPLASIMQNYKTEEESLYVEIIFKCKRRRIFRNDYNLQINLLDYVIVEVENGIDIGLVYTVGALAEEKLHSCYHDEKCSFSVIRIATEDDMDKFMKNSSEEFQVNERSKELIQQYNLDMKITDTEWQFDRQRLTIYFTAPQRVDFREMVKELARAFKTRIELRQISTREEAKRLGGVGSCGRHICCSTFSNDFSRVTLDHARTQQLSNNVAKLSGYCGRLKCCLLYEFDTYVDAFKKYPPLNSRVEIEEGIAKISKVDIFKDKISLQVNSSGIFKIISFVELQKLVDSGKVFPPLAGEEDVRSVFDVLDDFDDPNLLLDEEF